MSTKMGWEYDQLEDKKEKPDDFREYFDNWRFPEIASDGSNIYGWRVFGYDKKDPKKLKIGLGSDISCNTVIFAHFGVIIGSYVQIGPHSSIMSYSSIDGKKGPVVLKRNSRIGAYSTIMPGVTVGENSVVGAYSFVNKDIPDNVIAFGIPAEVVKELK